MLLRLRSDDQLVALFRLGNEEAFRVIHDRYRARLLAYARQMLGGARADAEDALQDVFLRAYHALRSNDRPVTLRAWLYRVAHNRCIDQLRRGGAQQAGIVALEDAAGDRRDPADEVQQREDLRRLVADVRRLPEQQRSALLMREMEGLTYQELAGALEVTVPAIKSLLVRARMGLVEAQTARDTACTEIRADLAGAHDRGVRASGRTRRHLRDCAPCRDYRAGLKGLEREIAGLAPGPGPWGTLAKLLGIGGSGAAAGGAGAAGGGALLGGGTLAGGAAAAKVAAVVCCAALVGGGAVDAVDATRDDHPTPARHHAAAPEAFARALAPLTATTATPLRRVAAAAASSAPVHRARRAHHVSVVAAPTAAPGVVHRDPSGALGADDDAATQAQAQAGGVLAPEEDEATTTDPPAEPVDDAAAGATTGEVVTGTSATTTAPTSSTPAPGGTAAGGTPATGSPAG